VFKNADLYHSDSERQEIWQKRTRDKGVNVNNSRLSREYDDSHYMDADLHIESHFGNRGDRSVET